MTNFLKLPTLHRIMHTHHFDGHFSIQVNLD